METDRSRRSTDTDSDTMDDPTVVDNHVAGMDPCYLTPTCTDINACRLWDIVPSTKLIWHSCFDEFRCAKLQVPMNHDTSSLSTDDILPPVEIALIIVCLDSNDVQHNI